jgi:thiamine biosynthesis lipoprotein
MTTLTEVRETFACFGAECTVIVSDQHRREHDAIDAVAFAKRSLLEWHQRFSRFEPGSEISQLNSDPRATVPVSPLMRRIVEASAWAARESGGLVNPTLIDEIEAAGYDLDLGHAGDHTRPLAVALALALAPPRAPAAPDPSARHRKFECDRRAGTVTRPPGAKLDPGGIAKGVFADELAVTLSSHAAFVVDCCGDLRLGGSGAIERAVDVQSPFDETETVHTFLSAEGAFATSGIGRRAWLDESGRPAHHLLDPASGRPAFTGIVQATALAPTTSEAEMRSKAALLSGPQGSRRWLAHGGVVVLDDGTCRVIEAG